MKPVRRFVTGSENPGGRFAERIGPAATRLGAAEVLTAAVLWGVSGTAAQVLMQREDFSPTWLVTTRLLVAGALVLILTAVSQGGRRVDLLGPLRRGRDALRLTVFAVVGILGFQISCFEAISAANAPAATFLQELGPVILALAMAVTTRRTPGRLRLLAMAGAFLGTGLLSTAGHLDRLVVPPAGIAWGVGSAFALAFYSAYPRDLLRRYDPRLVIGHGMLMAGIVSAPFVHPWGLGHARLGSLSLALLALVVILGTALAFTLYASSLRRLRPVESAFLLSAEPLTSALVASLWLGVHLTAPMILGGLCIVGAVIILARPSVRAPHPGSPSPSGGRMVADAAGVGSVLSELEP